MKKLLINAFLICAAFCADGMELARTEVLAQKLPQVYQIIYRHPELTIDKPVQRICTDREEVILSMVERYLSSTGKDQISILDIGCSQGYFCFKIKETFMDRVKITGIDLLEENIALCSALNKENSFNINFVAERFGAEFISKIDDGQYDITLLLSVIHHETRPSGSIYSTESCGCFQYARELLTALTKKSEVAIIELALLEEFREGFGDLPKNYVDWFQDLAFYKEIGTFPRIAVSPEDRRSADQQIMRPMVVASNKYFYIDSEFQKISK